jgi:hypothetical protein
VRFVPVAVLALLSLGSSVVPADAEIELPRGFTTSVYVTGDGFDATTSRNVRGLPSSTTIGFDHEGNLYVARNGRRYMGGEVEDIWPIYKFPLGGARLTPKTEGKFFHGPPLPNPQVAAIRGGRELFVSTFDRERRIGVLYRIGDNGRAELVAGGTPDDGKSPLLRQPEGAAADGKGNLYVADRAQAAIARLDPVGRVLDSKWFPVLRPRVLAMDGGDRLWIAADGPAEAPWSRGPGEIWLVQPDGSGTLMLRGPVSSGMVLGPGDVPFIADRQGGKIFLVTPQGRRVDFATYADGDAPRGLAFAPITPATRAAGIAGDLFVITIQSGAWPVNSIMRISGPFEDFVRRALGE